MSSEILHIKIAAFRKKYFLNQIIKGLLQFLIGFSFIFLIVILLEHFFWFSTLHRTLLFFVATSIILVLLVIWVIIPALKYFRLLDPGLSDIQLAKLIGQSFPEVSDRLLNALQLEAHSGADISIIEAGLDQYVLKLKPITFESAINLLVNLKYGKYLLFIMLSMCLIYVIIPGLYTNSTG